MKLFKTTDINIVEISDILPKRFVKNLDNITREK